MMLGGGDVADPASPVTPNTASNGVTSNPGGTNHRNMTPVRVGATTPAVELNEKHEPPGMH
jgi:hypothetical protein